MDLRRSTDYSDLESYKDSTTPIFADPTSRSTSPLLRMIPSFSKARRSMLVPKNVIILASLVFIGVLLGSYSSPHITRITKQYGYLSSDTSNAYYDDLFTARHHYDSNSTETTQFLPQNLCADLPDRTIADLRHTKSTTIRVRSVNGSIASGGRLNGPAPICIIVAVPQIPTPDDIYTDVPVEGKGPDTIHLYLNSTDVIVTFPPLRPLPRQTAIRQQISDEAVLYYAETTIFNEGEYKIVGSHEFANWRWAQQWNVKDGVFTYPTGADAHTFDIVDFYKYKPKDLPEFSFTATGPKRLPYRPTCDANTNGGVGRWYKQSAFPTINPGMVDEWGYAWQGDQCSVDYFTPSEVLDCVAGKTIHIFGDSMMRRLSKTLMSGGRWCLDIHSKCQDEDDNETFLVPKLDVDDRGGLVINEFQRGEHYQFGDASSIDFGYNSSIYFSFLSSITNSTMNWMDPLYNASDRYSPGPDAPANREIRDGAQSRPPPEMAKPDLVILGLGAWDQAFTDTFDAFGQRLVQFRDAFLHAYPSIPMAMRLSNSWCCRGTANGLRRYTGGRIQSFDDKIREVFHVDGAKAMDGRIKVVDPFNMNGRPDAIHDYGSSNANHPRASHVRIEMQMLVNSMCKRDGKTGKVSLRTD